MVWWQRLLLRELAVTSDPLKAERSRLVWGWRSDRDVYVLTPLGLVNTLRRMVGVRPWAMKVKRSPTT